MVNKLSEDEIKVYLTKLNLEEDVSYLKDGEINFEPIIVVEKGRQQLLVSKLSRLGRESRGLVVPVIWRFILQR